MNGKTVDGLLQIIEDYREHNRELKARIETFLFKSTPIPEFWENEEKETAGADISPKGCEKIENDALKLKAEDLRDTKFWKERGEQAGKEWAERHAKTLADKRIEDLMSYQDKQNEEIEKISTLRKQAICMLDEEVDKNISLKAEIKALVAVSEAERTCFGCKADIENSTAKPHICSMCECKDNWVAK